MAGGEAGRGRDYPGYLLSTTVYLMGVGMTTKQLLPWLEAAEGKVSVLAKGWSRVPGRGAILRPALAGTVFGWTGLAAAYKDSPQLGAATWAGLAVYSFGLSIVERRQTGRAGVPVLGLLGLGMAARYTYTVLTSPGPLELSPPASLSVTEVTMTTDYPGFGFAALVAAGGAMGFIKKRSVPSLAAGLTFGLLAAAGAWQASQPGATPYLGAGVSGLLGGVMGARAIRSGSVMPAGLVAVLGLAMFGRYSLSIYQGQGAARPQ